MITHRLVVRVDSSFDELKDKSVVMGNVSVHKRHPLVDLSGVRESTTNESRVRSYRRD